jgi:lactate dehydrogenase-like 2-hydroxyacid dehydrogenase
VHEVRGKTLGIIGLGEVGTELALRANALGMRVIYNDINRLSPEMEQRYQVEYYQRNDLIKESDYISLHVPHTPENDKMIGREQFAMMKPTAYLINT